MISEFYKNESNDNAVSSRKMAALWLRGSNPQGLDYQEKVCNEFAEHNGISIKKTYGCMGVSTGQQGELLNNMVSEVTQDQEINVILVFSEDRLSNGDGYSSMGSVKVYHKLRTMNIPAELHVYALANHAFRNCKPDDPMMFWKDRAYAWMKVMNLL